MDEWYASPKKHLSAKTIALIAAAVILVISLIAFLAGNEPDAGSTGALPAVPDTDTQQDYPSDFRDYLESYYTSTTTDEASIVMEKYEGAVNFTASQAEPAGEKLTLQELYAACSPAIVTITASKDGKADSSWGSGIIISDDGILLTNTHVIEGCVSAYISTNEGTEYDAKLIGADAVSDVAVLKILTEDTLPFVPLGDSDLVQTGDAVAAIGSPLGPTFHNTLTDGIISAVERGITYNGHTLNLLQTNTALNEGNSGGALFNMYGQVIGITNMKMMSTYSSIEGIGFAIPSETVVSVANQLLKTGTVTRSLIGITVGSIPRNVQNYYDLPAGLYVSGVTEGSGADQAGIQPGDIVTAVNGTPVTKTTEINEIKDALMPGDSMTFTIYRDGKTFDTDVVLTKQS